MCMFSDLLPWHVLESIDQWVEPSTDLITLIEWETNLVMACSCFPMSSLSRYWHHNPDLKWYNPCHSPICAVIHNSWQVFNLFPTWLTLFLGRTSSRVSFMSVSDSVTTSLSWISAKQLLKNSLILLTFLVSYFMSFWSNLSGVSLTCVDKFW